MTSHADSETGSTLRPETKAALLAVLGPMFDPHTDHAQGVLDAITPVLIKASINVQRQTSLATLEAVILSIDAMASVRRGHVKVFGLQPRDVEAEISGMNMCKDALRQTIQQVEAGHAEEDADASHE